MALSFFGKKPPASAGPVSSAAARPHEAEVSLPPPTQLSELDFTGTDAGGRGLGRVAGMVHVQEVGSGIGALFEEAAVLYANGNDTEALKMLNAVLDDDSAATGEGLWLMLLDLYRLTGQRPQFESRVLDYATRFERSPPAWVDLSGASVRPGSGPAPLVNLTGTLSSQADKQFQQIEVIGRRSGAVRIDVSRLRSVDEAGCGILRRTLAGLRAERVKVTLINVEALAETLEKRIAPGRAEERETWLMLLELLQYAGNQTRFEDLAVEYAVSFEESPPSWEHRVETVVEPDAGTSAAEAVSAEPDVFCFEGEMGGSANASLKKLAAFAADRRQVKVDCGRLRRLDFVCAGMLFNILATLQAQGKLVSLHNVNAMVAALMRVMSVDQVAHVTLRQ